MISLTKAWLYYRRTRLVFFGISGPSCLECVCVCAWAKANGVHVNLNVDYNIYTYIHIILTYNIIYNSMVGLGANPLA